MKIFVVILILMILIAWIDSIKTYEYIFGPNVHHKEKKPEKDIPDDFMNLPIEEVNAKEFAEIFGMSNKEVYRMLKENEIKGARKENGRWYIPITRTENITRYERNL